MLCKEKRTGTRTGTSCVAACGNPIFTGIYYPRELLAFISKALPGNSLIDPAQPQYYGILCCSWKIKQRKGILLLSSSHGCSAPVLLHRLCLQTNVELQYF